MSELQNLKYRATVILRTVAEKTVYWFLHGEQFYRPTNYNCRCVVVAVNGEPIELTGVDNG